MYKNIEYVLGEGKFIVKVFPADKWDKELGKFLKGNQQTVEIKGGKIAYKYNVESVVTNGKEEKLRYDNGEGKEYRCSILAFDEKAKAILDTGMAEINIVPKLNSAGEEMFKKDGDEFIKELRAPYINPLPRVGAPIGDQNDPQNVLYEDRFEDEDIPVVDEDEDGEKIW